MSHLLYIHGFLSSPKSFKAVQTGEWLQQDRSDIAWHCPFVSPYPTQAKELLESIVEEHKDEKLGLIGSSLGGFWSTWLVEKYDLRAVLINPAVKPSMLKPDFINTPLKNYHTDDVYELTAQHIDELLEVNVKTITRKDNYWLMVQAGDETLDYRMAVEKYAGCKQLIEEGGDHSFEGYEDHLPDIIEFLGL